MDTKNPISCVPGDSGIEEKKEGKLLQQIDAVLDIAFPPDKMPKLLNALIIKESYPGGVGYTYIICEVQYILENNRVLALMLMCNGESTLREGTEVLDTKAPLSALKGRTETFEGGQSIYIGQIGHPSFVNWNWEKKPLGQFDKFLILVFLAQLFVLFSKRGIR